MTGTGIGKLERVPLREVWKHEAYDFTQWLQDNVDVLNAALNITLVNVDREQAAGTFSIDLVAEDEGGGIDQPRSNNEPARKGAQASSQITESRELGAR